MSPDYEAQIWRAAVAAGWNDLALKGEGPFAFLARRAREMMEAEGWTGLRTDEAGPITEDFS